MPAEAARLGSPPSLVPPDPNVRCVAPPHPDGGTSFKIDASFATWDTRLRKLVATFRKRRSLPKVIDLVDADGVLLSARVKAAKAGSALSLVFDDQAQLLLLPDAQAAILEGKARGLWAHGVESWMTTWFDRATFLLTGQRCTSPDKARRAGWTTRRLELAADFVGLEISKNESELFVGARGGPLLVSSQGSMRRGMAETINIGKRGKHCLAISTHDKTQAVQSKSGRPEESVYRATWAANGWDGRASLRRVEARGHGRALNIVSRRNRRVGVDLRDPAALIDPTLLGRFWVHATTTRTRLVLASPSGSSPRLRGLPTDPRWAAVQAAGGNDDGDRYIQVPREERIRLDYRERVRRAEEAVARAVGRLVGLRAVSATSVGPELVALCIRQYVALTEETALAESSNDGWPFPPLHVTRQPRDDDDT